MKQDHSVYCMSHLLLVSLFMELNLPIFFTAGNMSLLVWSPTQRERGCWWHNWRECFFLSFSTLSLWACWRTEDFIFLFLFLFSPTPNRTCCFIFFLSPAEEISHFWHFDTSLTVREHGAPVYCWFLSLKTALHCFYYTSNCT